MSLVRRYVHEAGGKIALASLLGHETAFQGHAARRSPRARAGGASAAARGRRGHLRRPRQPRELASSKASPGAA